MSNEAVKSKLNTQLIKKAYVAYLSNQRSAHAKTKKRDEVRGGGRKPHKQKGTGRARAGSIRMPQWRGGGVVFGPVGNQNYTQKLNSKEKAAAIMQIFEAKADVLIVIEQPVFKKTKEAAAEFAKMKLGKNILFIAEGKQEELKRAIRNINGLIYCTTKNLNAYDLVNADSIVATKPAAEELAKVYGVKA